MGLNDNQMITRNDVHAITRASVFFTDLQKCVTKSECDKYDLLITSGIRDSKQCIPKTDLSLGNKFNIYYGIYNNKDSSVTLDYLKVQIAPNPYTSWTQVGSINPGTIASYSTKTGIISCTIPSSIDLTNPNYRLRLFCGNTLYTQQWYFCWRDYDNITTLPDDYWGSCRNEDDQSITNTDKAYSWRAYFMAPNADFDTSVLNHESSNDNYGTTKSRSALFMIK